MNWTGVAATKELRRDGRAHHIPLPEVGEPKTHPYHRSRIEMGDMSYLLGGYSSRKAWNTGLPVDGPKEKWKPCMEVSKATIEFLIQTERMAPQMGWRRDDKE